MAGKRDFDLTELCVRLQKAARPRDGNPIPLGECRVIVEEWTRGNEDRVTALSMALEYVAGVVRPETILGSAEDILRVSEEPESKASKKAPRKKPIIEGAKPRKESP